MSDFAELNQKVIDEFRANDGKVGGMFEGATIVLLSTTGAKSGETRINPLAGRMDHGHMHVFASMAGAPRNPDWYYNLKANPEVTVEVGTESYAAEAVEVTGAERDRIYAEMAAASPQFAEYEQKTDRTIPVVALKRR